jgi:hypothetical protein
MRKTFFYLIAVFFAFPGVVSAQKSETVQTANTSKEEAQKVVLKGSQKTQQGGQSSPNDKTDLIEMSGLGGAIFTVANTNNGSPDTYKHSLRITLSLLPASGKQGSYELIFYPPSENIQFSAMYSDGLLKIYYPISLYQGIKEKLDQSFAARKKVTVKVIQQTNGYCEGSLIF